MSAISSASTLAARALSVSIFPVFVFQSGNGKRSEEHTSELQSQSNLVCRLLLEKKKKSKASRACATLCAWLTVSRLPNAGSNPAPALEADQDTAPARALHTGRPRTQCHSHSLPT